MPLRVQRALLTIDGSGRGLRSAVLVACCHRGGIGQLPAVATTELATKQQRREKLRLTPTLSYSGSTHTRNAVRYLYALLVADLEFYRV